MSESLKRVDAEIKKLAREIAAPAGERPKFVRPDYSNLPSVDVAIPSGFPRAPVTHPYDPTKAAKLAEAEAALRDSLLGRSRQDTLALLERIHRHQAKHPIPSEKKPGFASLGKDPVRERVLINLQIRKST